jgi:hypothetical protein
METLRVGVKWFLRLMDGCILLHTIACKANKNPASPGKRHSNEGSLLCFHIRESTSIDSAEKTEPFPSSSPSGWSRLHTGDGALRGVCSGNRFARNSAVTPNRGIRTANTARCDCLALHALVRQSPRKGEEILFRKDRNFAKRQRWVYPGRGDGRLRGLGPDRGERHAGSVAVESAGRHLTGQQRRESASSFPDSGGIAVFV